jgi:branched-chain amino acid transport system substrate-binding protein
MLTLGAVYPLAGAQGSGGRQELAGVRAALRVAEQEGLLDQRVRLLVRSVQTPEQARQAVDGLIHQDHVPVIFGTYGSTLSYAAALEANRLHTIYWESGAVADLITQRREYVFRTVATGMTLGDSAVNFTDQVLLPRAGLKASQATAVIVNVDDVYGRSVADGEQALAARLGIHVLQRIQYPAQSYDPSVIAQEVAADHPDYLWDVSYLSDGEAIWKAIKASGVTLRAAIGTSSAFCLPQFGQQMGQLAVGTYAADHPSDEISPDALTPAARTLLGEAKDAYAALGYGHQMQIVGVAGFVAGWTLFHGVLPHVQGTVTPDRVRTVAYRINEPVGSSINGGGVRFAQPGSSDAGQNLRAPSIVGQWQAVDVWRTVWPMSYATAEPQGNSW